VEIKKSTSTTIWKMKEGNHHYKRRS